MPNIPQVVDQDKNWWSSIPKDEKEYLKRLKSHKTDFEAYVMQLCEYNEHQSSNKNSKDYKQYRKYYIKWGIIDKKEKKKTFS